MKYIAFLMVIILTISISAVALAADNEYSEEKIKSFLDKFKNSDNKERFLLKYLKQIDDDVFDLGTADFKGEKVQGYAFVHNKKEAYTHTSGTAVASTCYSFFGTGAKWKIKENWIVNPSNSEGLTSTFILNNLAADIQKWETASGKDIFGVGSLTSQQLSADSTAPDGKNEIYFADVSNNGAIAVTIVWGVFSGPTYNRKIIEWDQVYDDMDFDWSSSGVAGKMDFENIATHEIGHAFGMNHPSSTCKEETMYAYASYGETKKRSLNPGDTTGIRVLYR